MEKFNAEMDAYEADRALVVETLQKHEAEQRWGQIAKPGDPTIADLLRLPNGEAPPLDRSIHRFESLCRVPVTPFFLLYKTLGVSRNPLSHPPADEAWAQFSRIYDVAYSMKDAVKQFFPSMSGLGA